MLTEQSPSKFSRINRRSIALVNIGKLGQHAAEIDLTNSKDLDILARLMIGDGLEFTRHLEIDLESFQNGDFEFRPGLESCNLATVMREVFGLKDPNKDAELLEQVRSDLKSSSSVLSSLGLGETPDPELFRLAMNFLKNKGDGYENVANNASEVGLMPDGIPLAPRQVSSATGLDDRFEILRTQFSQGLLGNGEIKRPDIFIQFEPAKRSLLYRLQDSISRLRRFLLFRS